MSDAPPNDAPVRAATQDAVAIDAARTVADLSRRNAQLAVLNRVAELASAAQDLESFFRDTAAVVRTVARFSVCAIFALDEASGALVRTHAEGDAEVLESLPARLPDASPFGEVLRERVARVLEVEPPGSATRRAAFARSCCVAGVPLLARSRVIGLLAAAFPDGSEPARAALDLLSAVGAHCASAIESHRLLTDLRRRVGHLEAVHALELRVHASAAGDTRALLQDGCHDIARAVSARAAAVFLASPGRKTLRAAASYGVPRAAAESEIDLSRESIAAEVLRERAPRVCEDATRDPRSAFHGRTDVPPMALLAVPLASRAEVRGVVYVGDVPGRRFTEADMALANTLAGVLAIGLENAELYADTRRRVEELRLVHEVGRSLVETLDIEQVLDAGVRNLARIVDAPDAYLALGAEYRRHLEIRAVTGARPDAVAHLLHGPPEDTLAARVMESREPLVIEDALTDARVRQDLRAQTHGRACLALPLVVRDRSIGAVLIVDTRGPRLFTPAEVERAAAIANQLAVALENARLYEDLRRSYAQLRHAQQQLIHRERLAALGELSAVVAHEVRNPLGVIFNSLGSLRRLVRPAGDAKMLFDIVEEEADRLNRIVSDLLDFARPSTPELRPEQLHRIVEDAVSAALGQQGDGIGVSRELDTSLPPVNMDARLVRQAVLNVAVNAVQAMPRGGRITIRTRRESGEALLEIEDTGPGIADEVRERIFEPFFTTKASGTGLGLAVVKRIVEGHGGTLAVRTAPGSGAVFALRFPLAGPAVENDAAMG